MPEKERAKMIRERKKVLAAKAEDKTGKKSEVETRKKTRESPRPKNKKK
jgi:hypothetical protein